MDNRRYAKSDELLERACKVIPGGTNSGARDILTGGTFDGYAIEYPKFVKYANGSHIYDVDGSEFVDYCCAFGPIILGHAYPPVNNAVKEQIDRGSIYGLNTEVEVELAERIVKHVPGADMVRFLNTGSEATSIAVRMARVYTGKEKVLKFEGHYHGWHDWDEPNQYFYSDARYLAPGIPLNTLEKTITLQWNDLDLLERTLKRYAHDIAAVITEPYMFNSGVIPPEEGYLKGLRELTREHDIVLIMDEIITGFRLGLSGAQGLFGIAGDLTTLAKSMANGFTISAVTGTKEVMDKAGKIVEGTYNANPVSTTAALATITELEKDPKYDHINNMGNLLMKGLTDLIRDLDIEAVVQGPGPGFGLNFANLEDIKNPREILVEKKYPDARRNVVFHQEMLNRGIFIMPNARSARFYLCRSHSQQDVDKTLEAAGEAFKEAKKIK